MGVVLFEVLFTTTLAVCGKKRKDYWGKQEGRAKEGLFMLE